MTTPIRPCRGIRPRLVDEPGIRFGIAQGILVLATGSAAMLHLPVASALVLLGVTGVAGGYSTSPRWAALLGLSAWAFYTGFLENRLGQLTLAHGDVDRLLALTLVALAAALWSHPEVGRE